MKKLLQKYIFIIGWVILTLFFNYVYAIETHTKFWNGLVIVGPFKSDTNFRYYIEQDTRFVDDKYKFQQVLLWLGLGYKLSPTINIYAGDAGDVYRNYSGQYIHQNILWQQLSWKAYQGPRFDFMTNSRLEEIKRLHEAPWEVLLRQMQLFRIPLEKWKDHAVIIYDTLFFLLKNPDWTDYSTLISQNRAFVGIETKINDTSSYTIGYMNQYIFSNPNQMDHVIMLTFNVNNEHQNA